MNTQKEGVEKMSKILAGPVWAMAVVEIDGKFFAAIANKNEWGDDYTPEEWAACRKAELPTELVGEAISEMRAISEDRHAEAPVMNLYTGYAVR